jgi:hypothetical protein
MKISLVAGSTRRVDCDVGGNAKLLNERLSKIAHYRRPINGW